MASPPKNFVTPEEYLAMDRQAEFKSEYFDGEVFAMSGASRRHNLIQINVGSKLLNELADRPCEVYPSEMRVRIPNTYRYLYPDVSVVCGEPKFEGDKEDILLNPILVVEVLSDSTESYDRVKKFDSYRKIDSLQQYLLISQDEPRTLLHTRQLDNQWLFSEATDLKAALKLDSLGCELPLDQIYLKVSF